VSLAFSQAILGPFLVRRPDLVFVLVGPMTLSIPALWFRAIWGTPFLLDIQDLWPESVTGSGMLGAGWIESLISRCCTFAYRQAKRMIVLSDGYKRRLVERGARPDDVAVIYNWCDPSQENGDFDAPVKDTFGLAGTLNIVYAGNLGELQALETVVRAALILRDRLPRVRFVLLGSGTRESALRRLAETEGASNVRFISRLPLDRLAEVFHFASVLLVHLKQDPLSDVGIPQKIQAYLASGIPILAGVRGDAAELVNRSGGGRTCEPESPEDMAESLAGFAAMPEAELRAMGARGRKYYREHLSFDVGVRHVVEVLEAARHSEPRAANV
jgi:glycosyltransferase involved in cell wall biosynthesis